VNEKGFGLSGAVATLEREVSGVPSMQLKEIVAEYLDTDLGTFAQRVGIDKKYLKRLVINPTVPVIKLGLADRILVALDLSMSALMDQDRLMVVPLRHTRAAAMLIVDEEIWLAREFRLPAPDVEARIAELMALYQEHCVLTDRMIERREADRLRKSQ